MIKGANVDEPLLSLKNVNKNYGGVIALKDVDFEIMHGEIHGLVGENGSGKSTLIKIISGVVQPNPGSTIEINGLPFTSHKEIEAIDKGVMVIYQDLSLFPNLTVAENIALEQIISDHKKIISASELNQISKQAMEQININLPLDDLVNHLSVADQQLVAICRALTRNVKLIIMDEPTASLTSREVDSLFSLITDMKNKGITTLFVSHKLNEVFTIADRITVLRDGGVVGVYETTDVNEEEITMLMTGKKISYEKFIYPPATSQPILDCKNLSRKDQFDSISFQLFPGEILGITGLLGSGRTELALTLFGINQPTSGEIIFDGIPMEKMSIQKAMHKGIGYVPEDRLRQGLVIDHSFENNLIITTMEKLVNNLSFLDRGKIFKMVKYWAEGLSIKAPGGDSPVRTLSGGNQQKVVLAKWLAIRPKVLILDGPTIGIDVAAKQSIHETIKKLARDGIAIILISDEIPEVFSTCNRILVMHKGKIVREFYTEQIDQEEIRRFVYESNNNKEMIHEKDS